MAQFSDTLRNNMAATIESTIGTSGVIEIRTGAAPANCAAADTGTVLASISLPADWLTNPSAGVVSRNGTWTATASQTGTIGHYRFKSGSTCHIQGPAGVGLEMNTSVATTTAGQTFTVNTATFTAGQG